MLYLRAGILPVNGSNRLLMPYYPLSHESSLIYPLPLQKLIFTCRYTLHGEARPHHDKRIDEEVAPGFPGSVPRTSSTGSQLLLGSQRGQKGERLAMYEVNPIYDSANGKMNFYCPNYPRPE
jgi:hypothetical protein